MSKTLNDHIEAQEVLDGFAQEQLSEADQTALTALTAEATEDRARHHGPEAAGRVLGHLVLDGGGAIVTTDEVKGSRDRGEDQNGSYDNGRRS